MCGIVGCIAQSHTTLLDVFLKNSIASLRHRGPDSEGKWLDLSTGIGLGHTRLSIQDVSAAGNQPMHSHCGRYVITFNGEIYNHLELRKILSSRINRWSGGSDTETLLGCIATWGLEKTLDQVVGMFAFAIWDRQEQRLTIAQDRLGEKPLYYGYVGSDFVFASEIHVFKHHPAWNKTIDRKALAELLRYNYIPSPATIFRDIKKLRPGTFLNYDPSTKNSTIKAFWSVQDMAVSAQNQKNHYSSDAEYTNELDRRLRTAVASQMIADVPLGAFLSGGIDSAAIVATMQSLSSQPIKTFTIGFNEKSYNEAEQAKAVANHLGTDHTELYVSSSDVLEVIPKLHKLYTEPFADSSQIPTYLVSRLAKQSVKVALSGDGGDEVFGGYNRYLTMNSYWPKIRKTPAAIRSLVSTFLASIPSDAIDHLSTYLNSVSSQKYQIRNASDKVRKLASILEADDPNDFYDQLVSQWRSPESVVTGVDHQMFGQAASRLDSIYDDIERMMLSDQVSYLPDDILVKVDRAAMGASLETRTPFLDHRLVEFSWNLPLHMKIRNGQGKWLLRQLVCKHIPRALVERPKTGFAIPIDLWLKGPLREWAEELLDENRLNDEGYFYAEPIRKKWQEHLSGKCNWQHHLWSVLMFQSWLESE